MSPVRYDRLVESRFGIRVLTLTNAQNAAERFLSIVETTYNMVVPSTDENPPKNPVKSFKHIVSSPNYQLGASELFSQGMRSILARHEVTKDRYH